MRQKTCINNIRPYTSGCGHTGYYFIWSQTCFPIFTVPCVFIYLKLYGFFIYVQNRIKHRSGDGGCFLNAIFFEAGGVCGFSRREGIQVVSFYSGGKRWAYGAWNEIYLLKSILDALLEKFLILHEGVNSWLRLIIHRQGDACHWIIMQYLDPPQARRKFMGEKNTRSIHLFFIELSSSLLQKLQAHGRAGSGVTIELGHCFACVERIRTFAEDSMRRRSLARSALLEWEHDLRLTTSRCFGNRRQC